MALYPQPLYMKNREMLRINSNEAFKEEKPLWFIEHLLCMSFSTSHFHNRSLKKGSLCPLCRWANWDARGLDRLPQVFLSIMVEWGIWTWVWLPTSYSFHNTQPWMSEECKLPTGWVPGTWIPQVPGFSAPSIQLLCFDPFIVPQSSQL